MFWQKLNAAKTEMETKHKEVEEMKKTVRTITAEMEEKKHLLVCLKVLIGSPHMAIFVT